MSIDRLLFLSNELCSPSWQREMRLPLEFITFAHIKGKMYKHFRNNGSFVLESKKKWGNDVVYGGIFLLKDFDFYIRILDAYQLCSLSSLYRNHKLDIHHRITTEATPISFSTVDEFERLMYKEREAIRVQTYVGNPNHPKIKQRLNKTVSYRIYDGIDKKHFRELIREVLGYD